MIKKSKSLNNRHNQAFKNKELLNKSTHVGCFACTVQFTPDKIEHYVDLGETALCPYCDIDSVIPLDDQEENTREELLVDMHKAFFER